MQHNTWAEGYESLGNVLQRAHDQAAHGKGAQRHGQGQLFTEQPMQQLIALYGVGFALGQAGKKAQESQRMGKDAAVRELLGAINYLAGAVIHIENFRPGVELDRVASAVEDSEPDADGWIEWTGGECPVSPNSPVRVKFRGFGNATVHERRAADYLWRHDGDYSDIVAYRVVVTEKSVEPSADGWIAWLGGKCPVHAGGGCEVRLRDGSKRKIYPASVLRWTDIGVSSDIVAYRLVK